MKRLALILALAPTMSGCWWLMGTCGGGNYQCPPAEPVHEGTWTVDASDHDMPEMVDAVLDVTGDSVIVTFTDEHGRIFEAEYAIVSRYPEG